MNIKRVGIYAGISVAVIAILLVAVGVFLFNTTRGGRFASQTLLEHASKVQESDIGEANGSLLDGFTLKNLVFENPRGLPAGSVLKIQQLDIQLSVLSPVSSVVEIQNAQLQLPLSDPIIVSGTYKSGLIDMNVYCNVVDLKEILGFFELPDLSKISGVITDADVNVTGDLSEVKLDGKLRVKKLSYLSFSLAESPVSISMRFEGGEYKPKGVVRLEGGDLKARNISLALEKSRVSFSSDFTDPAFDAKATTQVGKTKIIANLKGTKAKPHIQLNSLPPFPEEQILVMLVTGKSWQSMESAVSEKRISPELAFDAVDYLLFGGEGAHLAKRFGLSALTVSYDEKSRGIGVTKELTDNVSVTLDREIKTSPSTTAVETNSQVEDKVLLKYQKSF